MCLVRPVAIDPNSREIGYKVVNKIQPWFNLFNLIKPKYSSVLFDKDTHYQIGKWYTARSPFSSFHLPEESKRFYFYSTLSAAKQSWFYLRPFRTIVLCEVSECLEVDTFPGTSVFTARKMKILSEVS